MMQQRESTSSRSLIFRRQGNRNGEGVLQCKRVTRLRKRFIQTELCKTVNESELKTDYETADTVISGWSGVNVLIMQ